MSEANSPYFRAGLIHGAYDAARPGHLRRWYHPAMGRSWMYRKGFARGFLAARDAEMAAELSDGPGVVMTRTRPEQVASGRLGTATVLRWGHARREAFRKLGKQPPVWIAALEREYQRRRYVQSKRATRAAS